MGTWTWVVFVAPPAQHLHIVLAGSTAAAAAETATTKWSITANGEAAADQTDNNNNIIVRVYRILVWSVTQCKVTWPPLCLRRGI